MDDFNPAKIKMPKTAERALVALAHILRREARLATKRRDLFEDLMQEMAWAVLVRGDGRALESYLAAARRRMWQVIKKEIKEGRDP